MKSLATHSPSNVASVDEPGPGGACHEYVIVNPGINTVILFQRGARNEHDSKGGIFDDDLLAILEDRLAAFQAGPFACAENESALVAVRRARTELAVRVADRMKRGVLGHEKA